MNDEYPVCLSSVDAVVGVVNVVDVDIVVVVVDADVVVVVDVVRK